MFVERMHRCPLSANVHVERRAAAYPTATVSAIDARRPLPSASQNGLQESEAEKRDRLLLELSDDTKTQKKKPWYGLF